MISYSRKGAEDVEEQAHGGADHSCAEAGRGRTKGRRCGAGAGSVEAHDLCLEGEVWRHGCERGAGSEAKQLRDENTRLRKLVADLSLDKEALQSVIRKNGWSS